MLCTEIKPHLLPLTLRERGRLERFPITRVEELEAAMCAWEHLVEKHLDNPEGYDALGGAMQARYACGNLPLAIHTGYQIAKANDQLDAVAFDWEFVPWFMDNCVIWDNPHTYNNGTPPLKEKWVQLCREVDL